MASYLVKTISISFGTVTAIVRTMLFVTAFIAATLFSVSPTAQAYTCDDLIDVVEQSRTLAELRDTVQQLKIPASSANQCQSKLKQNTKIQQLVSARKNRINVDRARKQLNSQRQVKALESLPINRRVVQLRDQAKIKLNQLQDANKTSNFSSSQLTKPRANSPRATSNPAEIYAITPTTIVPGTDVVIEGENFGNVSGTVRLTLQGRTFSATINGWTDTWINAYFSDSIGGVLPSDNAVISVQVPQQSAVHHNTPFIPLYVQESLYEEYDSPGNVFFPGSGTATILLGKSLLNGWRVSSYSVSAEPGCGQCELGTPSMSVGNARLESQLDWSYDWLEGFAWCYVNVYIEGPQGMASGL